MSGRLADSQTVRYMDFPEVDTWDIDRWVTKVFAKKLAKKDIYANIILEVEGRLYDVGSGDAWTRNKAGLYTIGSGGDLAFGALVTGVSVMDALEVAAEWDTYTGGLLTVQTGESILSEW